jgi:two-component system nitrate/nitrite response regulator NarL
VLKEQAPAILLKAIEKVHAGEVWIDRSMLAHVLNEMVGGEVRPANTGADRLATLTEREREVLALVNQGLKNKRISDRLSITETTVRHHLTSIFAKLGVESRLELVIFSQRQLGRTDR